MKPRTQKLGTKNIIGANVVRIRKARGIKQGAFLTKLNLEGLTMSPTSLSRLEGQHRLVQDKELVILAKTLDVDVRELLGLM